MTKLDIQRTHYTEVYLFKKSLYGVLRVIIVADSPSYATGLSTELFRPPLSCLELTTMMSRHICSVPASFSAVV